MYSQLPLIQPWQDRLNWLNYPVGRVKQDAEKTPKHTTDSFDSICRILARPRIKRASTFYVSKVDN